MQIFGNSEFMLLPAANTEIVITKKDGTIERSKESIDFVTHFNKPKDGFYLRGNDFPSMALPSSYKEK